MALAVAQSLKKVGTGASASLTTAVSASTFVVWISGGTGTNPTVSDSKGNSYSQVVNLNGAITQLRAFVCENGVGGAGHTWTGGGGMAADSVLIAAEVTGATYPTLIAAATASGIDTGSPYTVTSGGASLPTPTVAFVQAHQPTGANPQSYAASTYSTVQSELNDAANYSLIVFSKALSATTPETATVTGSSSSTDMYLSMLVFQESIAGGWNTTGTGPRSVPVLSAGPTSSGAVGFFAGRTATGNSYFLTSASGTFTLTGQAAAVKAGHRMVAAAGSFALTGNNAGLTYGRKIAAAVGNFTLTGQAANFPHTYRVTSAVGTFALTGQAALINRSFRVVAGAGTFAFTGQAVAFRLGKSLAAAQGVFTLTGNAASFPLTRRLTAGSGSFALTGYAATLLTARTFSAARGTFAVTGNAANIRRGYPLAAGKGTFVLTGQPVSFNGQLLISAAAGTFTLTGQAAGLRTTRRLVAGSGSFALTGQPVNIPRGRFITAGAGAFELTGQSANISRGYVLSAVAGAYTLTGRAVNITVSGGIDYHAIAMAVWSFVLSNGKTAEETLLENNAMLSTLTGPIEGTLTASDLIKVIGAVAAGKTTIDSAAPGTAHVEFAAVDGADIRVAADMTGSERTDVAITL